MPIIFYFLLGNPPSLDETVFLNSLAEEGLKQIISKDNVIDIITLYKQIEN